MEISPKQYMNIINPIEAANPVKKDLGSPHIIIVQIRNIIKTIKDKQPNLTLSLFISSPFIFMLQI